MAPYVLAHTLVNHIMRSLTDILSLFSSGRISKTSFGVIIAKKKWKFWQCRGISSHQDTLGHTVQC